MDSKTGELRSFASATEAKATGFDIPLTDEQAKYLEQFAPEKRVQELRRMQIQHLRRVAGGAPSGDFRDTESRQVRRRRERLERRALERVG